MFIRTSTMMKLWVVLLSYCSDSYHVVRSHHRFGGEGERGRKKAAISFLSADLIPETGFLCRKTATAVSGESRRPMGARRTIWRDATPQFRTDDVTRVWRTIMQSWKVWVGYANQWSFKINWANFQLKTKTYSKVIPMQQCIHLPICLL